MKIYNHKYTNININISIKIKINLNKYINKIVEGKKKNHKYSSHNESIYILEILVLTVLLFILKVLLKRYCYFTIMNLF